MARGPVSVLLLGLFVAGCAPKNVSVDREQLGATLQARTRAAAAGRTGTITGNLYLLNPALPTLLRDHPVTLLPLSADLEAAIAEAGGQFAKTREPLSPQALAAARRPLDDSIASIKAQGQEGLIKTVRTEQEQAGFTFVDVPEGRWLLLAELDTPLSTLLWAVPLDVEAGRNAIKRLNDGNVWLEGLKP